MVCLVIEFVTEDNLGFRQTKEDALYCGQFYVAQTTTQWTVMHDTIYSSVIKFFFFSFDLAEGLETVPYYSLCSVLILDRSVATRKFAEKCVHLHLPKMCFKFACACTHLICSANNKAQPKPMQQLLHTTFPCRLERAE